MTEHARQFWGEQAATFAEAPDHGLKDPAVRHAWADLLLPLISPASASVVDLGCGTGSLSVLLVGAGHIVRGMDASAGMIGAARDKAAATGLAVEFMQGDAADPPYEPASADVLLTRHVVWTLPDPDAALSRWVRLLKPEGRLVLVEGRWSTGAGMAAADCQALVRRHREEAAVRHLNDATLWGQLVEDERYLILSRR